MLDLLYFLLLLMHLPLIVLLASILLILLSLSPGLDSLLLVLALNHRVLLLDLELLHLVVHDIRLLYEGIRKLLRRRRIVRVIPVHLTTRLKSGVHQNLVQDLLFLALCNHLR